MRPFKLLALVVLASTAVAPLAAAEPLSIVVGRFDESACFTANASVWDCTSYAAEGTLEPIDASAGAVLVVSCAENPDDVSECALVGAYYPVGSDAHADSRLVSAHASHFLFTGAPLRTRAHADVRVDGVTSVALDY